MNRFLVTFLKAILLVLPVQLGGAWLVKRLER
jgi:hypothetical protein